MFVEVTPRNQTVRAREWANFSCKAKCSQRGIIVWYINGSALSTSSTDFITPSQNPPLSYCSSSFDNYTSTEHNLSLQVDDLYDFPAFVYCAIISVCDKTKKLYHLNLFQ